MAGTIRLKNDDVLEVRYSYTLYEQVCINTFHYRVSGVTSSETLLTGAQINTNVEPIIVGAAAVADIGLAYIQSQSVLNLSLTYQVIAPFRSIALPVLCDMTGGNVAAISSPPTVTYCIKRLSVAAGRKFRGRIFPGGVPVSWISGGVVSPANRLAVSVGCSLLANTIVTLPGTAGAATLAPIIYSLKHPANAIPVADYAPDYILRSQRRREVGRGI